MTLETDLRAAVDGDVAFDAGTRAMFATDASNYRHVPIGVVYPREADDVVAAVDVCRRHRAPILGRGGGTSLAGQACNEGVVFDFSKYMNRVLAIDPAERVARVQPGVVLDDLRAAAAEYGLTFGPDPSTHTHCTLGGMIGNNSCGVHSVTAGRTVDNVETLDVLTYDGTRLLVEATTDDELGRLTATEGRAGEIYRALAELASRHAAAIRARYPKIPRRVSGYNLDELLPENGFHVARSLVGSESTCVLVLEATVRLVAKPTATALLVLGYPDIFEAADDVPAVLEHEPIGLEALDDLVVEDLERKRHYTRRIGLLPAGHGWLLAEFGGGSRDEAAARARAVADALSRHRSDPPSCRLYDDPADEEQVWRTREAGLGATARVPGDPDTWEGWEDAAVAPDRLGGYLRGFRRLLDRYGYRGALYGHFGDGCVHTRITFDLVTAGGIATYRRFLDHAADLVVEHGGSLSGEHGDGHARAALLPKMFGDELIDAFRAFKRIWDPDGQMNPGRIVDPAPPTDGLRLGVDYRPTPIETHFGFVGDDRSFARAAGRCVGIGECRRAEGGVMCPSWRATGDEQHSTRGRARLLFEFLSGRAPLDGSDEPLREALDLCLACKGCKSDCPVNVDMATYKAEFLARYYRRRLRPRSAYAMGLIMHSARLGSRVPRIVNALAANRATSALLKRAAGLSPHRDIPRLATTPFTRQPRATRAEGAPRVVLWPDTFSNYFEPRILSAAVQVLEHAGFVVDVPEQWVCCGRPLYDFGFLGHARSLLQRNLRVLEPAIRAGTPIVGLEPSCVSVFRDELPNLLHESLDAPRLASQFLTLTEFLDRNATDAHFDDLDREAIAQAHCHHVSVLDYSAEERLLARVGVRSRRPETSCCGMAGAFGFEGGHYELSTACAQSALIPAIESTDDAALLIADGFSCREQIRQATGREPAHVAEVLAAAIARPRTESRPRSQP